MSSLIYFVADLYPWWGIPLAFIFFELANARRRRGERKMMLVHLSISLVFLALAGAYFAFNGMEHLRPAMQQLEHSMSNK